MPDTLSARKAEANKGSHETNSVGTFKAAETVAKGIPGWEEVENGISLKQ